MVRSLSHATRFVLGTCASVALACGARSPLDFDAGVGVSSGGKASGAAPSGGVAVSSGGSASAAGGTGAGGTGGLLVAPSDCDEPGGVVDGVTFDGQPVYRLGCGDRFDLEGAISADGEQALIYGASAQGLMRYRWQGDSWSAQLVDARGGALSAIDSLWVDSYWDQSLITFAAGTEGSDLNWMYSDPGTNGPAHAFGAVSEGIQAGPIRTGAVDGPARIAHTTRSGRTTLVVDSAGGSYVWQDGALWLDPTDIGPSIGAIEVSDNELAILAFGESGDLVYRFFGPSSLGEQVVQPADPSLTAYSAAPIIFSDDGKLAYAWWVGTTALGQKGFVAQRRGRTWKTLDLGLIAGAPSVTVNAAGDAVVAWAQCDDSACAETSVKISLWAADGEEPSSLSSPIPRCGEVRGAAISRDGQTWAVPVVCGERTLLIYPAGGGIVMPEVPNFDSRLAGGPEIVITPGGRGALVMWGVFDPPDANTNVRPVALYSAFLRFDWFP